MLEAKACHSWHDYELGSRESKRRPGNIGIYLEQLVQAMEGERENTRPPAKKKQEKEAKNKKNKIRLPPEKRKEKETQLSTQGPQKKNGKKENEGQNICLAFWHMSGILELTWCLCQVGNFKLIAWFYGVSPHTWRYQLSKAEFIDWRMRCP